MPYFSIIIPVYNVAPYLRECLDSVLAQTFTDWEAICVDDGSTDGSGAILDEYAAKDKRFRVIHQANAGVSAARNAALAVITGKWFLFLDGDDLLRNDALSILVPYVKNSVAYDGILIYPSIPYWDGCEIPKRKIEAQILLENASKEDLFLGKYAANGYVMSRIYRRQLFGQLRFRRDIAMAEDICFWFDALCVDARWMILNAEYYLYRQRTDSVCGSKNPHYCVQALEAVVHAIRDIDKIGNNSKVIKLDYLRRFPYTVVYNLNLASLNVKKLTFGELREIKNKIKFIEKDVGCWPFAWWLKFKISIATSRFFKLILPLLIRGEQVYLIFKGACRKLLSLLLGRREKV